MTNRGDTPQIHAGITPALRALVWDVFFASRGRGISLAAHLPWLDAPTGIHGLSLEDARVPGGAGAALVIRERHLPPSTRAGLIGLVCVHESLRGRGLSTQLLHAAIRHAEAQGLDELVLWTGKPEVYTSAGFEPVDQELFVRASAPARSAAGPAAPARRAVACALPAFATAAWQTVSGEAQLTWLEGPAGVTLAGWQGAPDVVAELLLRALPTTWSVNLPANDPLLPALARCGADCTTQPGAWRMRRRLKPGAGAPLPPIPLLERI